MHKSGEAPPSARGPSGEALGAPGVARKQRRAFPANGKFKALDDERREFAGAMAGRLQQNLDLGKSVPSVATASSLGDFYQYVIDRPVDLACQKSSLRPTVSKDVEGKRVSIYNPAVQPKRP